MKTRRLLFLLLILFVTMGLWLAVGLVLAQSGGSTGPSFAVVREFGRQRPQGIQYDPNYDQIVMVDQQGRLLLVDAATFETHYVLYENETYNAYRFSHDGRWLAAAIGRRVDLWDTQAGIVSTSVEPEDVIAIQGPLQFSGDDGLLLINALIPAPADIRRSENDTSNLPYLWDLAAARNEAVSTLPGSLDLVYFYDYLFGFVLGPNRKAVGALPQRFQLIDASNKTLPVLTEVKADRNERDPISIWYSLQGDQIYILPQGRNSLVQLNTTAGTQLEIPIGRTLSRSQIISMQSLVLSNQARIVGQPHSRSTNSFLNLLLGDDYPRIWNYHPLTITLLDILDPITIPADQAGLLVYVMDDQTGEGMIDFVRPVDMVAMALHPDNVHLAVRRASGAQVIEVYNLDSGILEQTIFPALPVPAESSIFSYNGTGEVLVCDFQRFDSQTGKVLYEDLSYVSGFDSYFFTRDSRRLVTMTGSTWWLWDIETGKVIRREQVNLRGSLVSTSSDGHRFLTRIDTANGPGMELVNIGTDQRQSVVFEPLPGRDMVDMIASPDWENFLIVYSASPNTPHYPGSEIAIYNLYSGQQWFIAGDDLLPSEGWSYGWYDNQTITIYRESTGGGQAPARVYGIEYHPSGLPACLVKAFPDLWPSWLDLWERLNANLRPDELGRLSQRLCEVIPGDVNEVNAVFYPSPTPTLPPITPTPAAIAGVPLCLTSQFPGEAVEYARVWREISAGLSPEQAAELEKLLCEGLGGASLMGRDQGSGIGPDENIQVMTINIKTGVRAIGGYIPQRETVISRSLQLVLAELYRTEHINSQDARLSPDGTLLAVHTPDSFITFYRLLTPYQTLADNATATAAPREDEPRGISILPAPTQAFDVIGGPRPTLTPTVTPTAPPRATEIAPQASTQIQEVCPSQTRYSISTPLPGYSPTGYLLVQVENSERIWVLDPATGELWPDDRLPACYLSDSCSFSFDQQWMSHTPNGNFVISRPDGSEAKVLFTAVENPEWPSEYEWVGLHTFRYSYETYMPERYRNPVAVIQRLDPASPSTPPPFMPAPSIIVNELYTETVATQPDSGQLALVRTSFNTGQGTGYKYYIYDRETGIAEYFARLANNGSNELEAVWHPLGKVLYYRYPDSPDWYIFDPVTHQQRWLGQFPGGDWSREGRYRVDWFELPSGEFEARDKAGLPVPKLAVWDSATGLTRRYCIPGTNGLSLSGTTLVWSPDSRYLAFRVELSEDGSYDTVRPRTFILDTQTGSVTELTFVVTRIILWTDNVPERP